MEDLRKPFFIAALVLILIAVGIELGTALFPMPKRSPSEVYQAQCTKTTPSPALCSDPVKFIATIASAQSSNPARPGLGIPYLALVDAIVLFTMLLIGSSLIVPASIEGRVQGCATLIFGVLLILASIVFIFLALGAVILMVSLLLSFPFGTIAYMAIFGFFDTGGASATLGLIMLLKIVAAVCLVLAQQRFLQNIGLVVIVVASLVANVIVSFLQGFPPGFLVSITDAIAAIVVGIIAVICLILLLVGSLTSIIKALNPAG